MGQAPLRDSARSNRVERRFGNACPTRMANLVGGVLYFLFIVGVWMFFLRQDRCFWHAVIHRNRESTKVLQVLQVLVMAYCEVGK